MSAHFTSYGFGRHRLLLSDRCHAENGSGLRASTGSDATAAAGRGAVEIFSVIGFEFAAITRRPEPYARPAFRRFGPPTKDLDSARDKGLRSLVGDQGTTQ